MTKQPMRQPKPVTVDEYMDLPWKPVFTDIADGHVRVTIPQLKDFLVVGPREEVDREWKQALKGLLQAYIKSQKAIPVPGHFSLYEAATNVFELQWTLPRRKPQPA